VFAISAPLITLVLLLVILTSNYDVLRNAPRIIARPIVVYAFIVIPVGFVALAKELGILGVEITKPRFDIRMTLIGTALFAIAFTVARPCLAFGVEAFLAGGLFTLTVFGTAFVLGYWFYKQEGFATPFHWTALGAAALLLLVTHTSLVVWYDGVTDFGYILVRTSAKETLRAHQVILRVHHVESGRVYYREVYKHDQWLGRIRSGTINVSVFNRDDLQVVPATMKVLGAAPTELRVEPVDPSVTSE